MPPPEPALKPRGAAWLGGAWLLPAGLLAAGAALLGIFLAMPLPGFLERVIADDALYYLVPAQNFLLGLGTTFDGLNLSNGYHPLWMLLAIAGAWATPASLHIYLLPALSGLCYLLGALLLAFCLFPERSRLQKTLLFALFCFNFRLFTIFLFGMENGLNFLLLAALLVFLLRRPPEGEPARLWALGGLLSLLALSRVDQILFAFFVLAILLLQHRQSPGRFVRDSLPVGLPILLLFGGYLCMNKLVFGLFLPVSGHVKSWFEGLRPPGEWPNGGFWENLAFHFHKALSLPFDGYGNFLELAFQPIAVLGFGYGLYKVWKRELSPYYLAFAAFAVFHLLLYAIRLPHFTRHGNWYFTPEFLVVILSFFFGLEACLRLLRLRPRLRRALGAAFCVGACLAVFFGAVKFTAKDRGDFHFHQAALWINENLPEGVVIGAHSAGILGYFVERRPVVNLDGLINSAEYFEVLQKGRFPDYVRERIDYYAEYSPNGYLETNGVCWLGSCVPREEVQLLKTWKISETENYVLFQVRP